ncbi:hypothetical protein HKD37_02G003681 [Glycine soja]
MAYSLVDGASSHLFSFILRCRKNSISSPSFLPKSFPTFQALSLSPTATSSHNKSPLCSVETPHQEEPFNRSEIFQTCLAVLRLAWNRGAETKNKSPSDVTRNPRVAHNRMTTAGCREKDYGEESPSRHDDVGIILGESCVL